MNKKIKTTMIVTMCPKTNSIGEKDGTFPWGNIQGILDQISILVMDGSTSVGCPLIVGSKTFEKIKDNLLQKCPYIVLSRGGYKLKKDYSDGDHGPKVRIVNCIKRAREEALECESHSDRDQKQMIIIGGDETFKKFLQHTDQLIIFYVASKNGKDIESDIKFPNYRNCGLRIKSPGLEISDPYYKVVMQTLVKE